MAIVVTYSVNNELYYNPDVKHQTSLITTEYKYKSDILIRLQIYKNLGIRLNNVLSYDFKRDLSIPNEQYLFKKAYSKNEAKPITRSTFEDKFKRLDMAQTTTEHEILEEYPYMDIHSRSDEVQIVITKINDVMTAVIDFKDAEQYENFTCPAWLTAFNQDAAGQKDNL